MKITDSRTITVEIDGAEHTLTLDEVQRLYDELGKVHGVVRHRDPVIKIDDRPHPVRQSWDPPFRWTSVDVPATGVGRLTFNCTRPTGVSASAVAKALEALDVRF